jgi:hypothetical protein
MKMEDAQLHALRHDPPQEFVNRLRGRLDGETVACATRRWPIARFVAPAAAAAGIALLLTVPAVRASAQSFLALFRVAHFVALPVDTHRLDALKAQQLDLRTLIGEHVQVIQDPGPSTPVLSIEQASAAAGYAVKVPGWLPANARIIEMAVTGDGLARVTASASRLQHVMDALGITDLSIPEGLDGQIVTVRAPRIVMIRYEHDGRRTRFFQAPSPEVTMAAGIDLPALGEIGLRILGLSRAEARDFAPVIDWNSTLIVPLPAGGVRSFRQVTIGGNPGIAVEYEDSSRTNMVLWSNGGRVFGLVSLQEMEQVLEMANSVR